MSEPQGKVLTVEGNGIKAVALWLKLDGVWRCHGAPRVFAWMQSATPEQVKARLVAEGYAYSWHG